MNYLLIKGECSVLRTPTVPRKWYFSYGTSSCITYFKLRKHLTLIKCCTVVQLYSCTEKKIGMCDLDDLAMAAILFF